MWHVDGARPRARAAHERAGQGANPRGIAEDRWRQATRPTRRARARAKALLRAGHIMRGDNLITAAGQLAGHITMWPVERSAVMRGDNRITAAGQLGGRAIRRQRSGGPHSYS